ncbi:uncharacterized protein LOC125046376 [Penaeus chinensis]|uniref:uncharacterized protein LOC125046376 n=1 Tax=Penaeus chinensis TaxID=139456 RepID=UPI001FB79A82|nr:uncharacterized protein LOC125046376 [Penaeus chinensis]
MPSLIHTYLPSSPSPPPTRRRVVLRKRRPLRPHHSQINLSSLRSKNLRPILRKRRPHPPLSTPTSSLSLSHLVSITSALPKVSSITGDNTETAFSSGSHETHVDSEKPALNHHEEYAASLTPTTSLTHLPTSSIPPTSSSNIPNDGILSTTSPKPSVTSSRSPTSSSITIAPSIEVSPHGFPTHELHHPVSSSTTLAPTGETLLHSRLPIPTDEKQRPRPAANPPDVAWLKQLAAQDKDRAAGTTPKPDKEESLEEVRQYSLSLYRHLQEQLKARQLSLPRRKRTKGRRRVTRQTVTPTEETVTAKIGEDTEIEDMLLHGLAFIPPVDPVKLKAAVEKLVQLANNRKKKSHYSYPKSTSRDPLKNVESITESSPGQNRHAERLQEIEITGIDASLPSEEVEEFERAPQRGALTSPNTFALPNQGSQVSPTSDDGRDSYISPVTTINTLDRGTFTSRSQGRRRSPSSRRRKVKGSHDGCPYPHTTRRRRPLVPPTLPMRPTIPELMTDSPPVTSASRPQPGARTPGADPTIEIPTTSVPNSNVPSDGRFPNSHQPVPSPDYEDDYAEYEYDDNDYEYEAGIDPGLTEGSNTTADRTSDRDSSDRSLSGSDENERPVIILVEPEDGRDIPRLSEGLSNPFARLQKQNESPLIIVDPANSERSSSLKFQNQNQRPILIVDDPQIGQRNQGRSLSRSRYFGLEAKRKQGRVRQITTQTPQFFPAAPKTDIRHQQNAAVILVDPNDTNLRTKASNLENSPGSEQGGSVIILVDPEGGDGISGAKLVENGKDSSPIIIVDNRNRNTEAGRAGGRHRNKVSPIILVESKEKDGGPRTGRRVSEWDGEGSVIILVEPDDGSELPTPKPADTLNPSAEPPSIQLVPPPEPLRNQFESFLSDNSKPQSRPVSNPPAAGKTLANLGGSEGSRGSFSSPRRGSRRPLGRHRFRNLRSRERIRGSPRFVSRNRGRGSRERGGTGSRETGLEDEQIQRQRGNRGFTSGQDERPGKNFDFGSDRSVKPTGNKNFGSNPRGISQGTRDFFDDYEDDLTASRGFPRRNRNFPDDRRQDPTGSREFFTSSRNMQSDGRDFTAERAIPNRERTSSEFSAGDNGDRWGSFSWFSDFPAEVSLTRTEETIPEKIRELRHSIEEKARAWTQFGLQRTRPEFRRTRRPARK